MVAGEREERKSHAFPLFILGLVLGVAATIILPRVLGPRLPGTFRTGNLMEGRVLAKLVDGDRLLLKVQTDENVYLATFEERQREIELLVDQGDLVTLQIQGTDPFPMGPAIRRVRKPQLDGTAAAPAATDSATEVPSNTSAAEAPEPPESESLELEAPELESPEPEEGALEADELPQPTGADSVSHEP